MSIEYVAIDCMIPENEKIDENGRYLEHPMFSDEVMKLFVEHKPGINKVIFVGTSWNGTDKKRLIKLADELVIDRNIVTLPRFDRANRRLVDYLRAHTNWENELNLLFQSSDQTLLREFMLLFPEPYRRRLELKRDDLGDRASLALEDVARIVAQLDDDSFLISSALEGCMFCVFAHEPTKKLIMSWRNMSANPH